MRTLQEVRMDCMRIASSLAIAKAISSSEIIQKANELFGWVTKVDDVPDRPQSEALGRLKERFR